VNDEIPGVSPLSLAERDKLTQFLTKTPTSGVWDNGIDKEVKRNLGKGRRYIVNYLF
jgi:hypothetical protein